MKHRITHLLTALTAAVLLSAAPVFADEAAEVEVEVKRVPSLFGLDLGIDLPWTRVGSETVVYEAPRYGGDARLFVLDKRKEDNPRWRVYRGPAYERIVKDHPELGTHAGITLFGVKLGARAGVRTRRTVVATHRPGMQRYVAAPGMTYETSSFDNRTRLYVMENGHEYVYVGNDLDAIAKRHPHVTKMESYPVLRKRTLDNAAVWRTTPRSKSHSHVQVWRRNDGYTVRTWDYADGRWASRAYQGESLAVIARDNPEAAKHLHLWTDAKWSTPVTKPVPITVAGATLVRRMRDGKSVVVVHDVKDATYASTLMLKPGDELVRIGKKHVTGLDDARRKLAAATMSTGTDIEIVRDGKRMTLSQSTSHSTTTPKRTP